MLEQLVKSLLALDYPREKLQILLTFEESDAATIEACRKLSLASPFELIVTPDSYPRTKPKACDWALQFARGDYVVIYDAEDRPEVDQLKKAAAAFREAPGEVICFQARLNIYNRDQNWLTRWFTVDYSTWFDLSLPGLSVLNAPIPLGGTSNHFRRRELIELGGWDPYNVAEDCDLGIRLHRRGYRTRMLESTTWEEACSRSGNLIRQRSRWIKGYAQTFLVHSRRPRAAARELGFAGSLHFLIMIGGSVLAALINPLFWILASVWAIWRPEAVGRFYPAPIFLAAVACLFVGNFALVYSSMLACGRRGYYSLVKYALMIPPYWALASISAWKGFFQLIFHPHYWEKTVHGQTSNSASFMKD